MILLEKKKQDGKKLTTILFVYWQQNFITKKCLLDGKTVSVPNKTYGGAISLTNKLALGLV